LEENKLSWDNLNWYDLKNLFINWKQKQGIKIGMLDAQLDVGVKDDIEIKSKDVIEIIMNDVNNILSAIELRISVYRDMILKRKENEVDEKSNISAENINII